MERLAIVAMLEFVAASRLQEERGREEGGEVKVTEL
jgi:hypothetical protein